MRSTSEPSPASTFLRAGWRALAVAGLATLGASAVGPAAADEAPRSRAPIEREPIEREAIEREPIEREPIEREPIGREPIGRDTRRETRALDADEASAWRSSPARRARDEAERGIVLSLAQAIEIALYENLSIGQGGIERRIARASVEGARGAFDPVFSFFYQHRRDVQPTATELDAATSVSLSDVFSASIEQQLWYGAHWEVGVDATRRESNNPFTTLSPSYLADVTITYTQPLLEGLGRDSNLRELRRAINDAAIAEKTFKTRVADIVRQTIDAYWDLVFAREDLAVREASLSLADRLLDQNRIMVEVGTLAPLDLAESRAAVAERRQGIIEGERAAGDAADALRVLLGLHESSEWWSVPIVPADEPRFRAAWVDLGDAIDEALTRREEIEAARLRVENAGLDVAFSRDALRPQLDLQLSLSTAGLGGDLRDFVDLDGDTVPDAPVKLEDGDFGDAFRQVGDRDFDSWAAQLVYTQPLFNRAAKSRFLTSRLQAEQRLIELEQVRQDVVVEVRSAVRAVEAAREAIAAAQATVRLQEEKLDAEIKKFENGMSTNFRVLEFQTDLTTARSQELRARTSHLKALAALERARGALLDEGMLILARQ